MLRKSVVDLGPAGKGHGSGQLTWPAVPPAPFEPETSRVTGPWESDVAPGNLAAKTVFLLSSGVISEPVKSRRSRCVNVSLIKVRDVANVAGILATAVLFGLAYAVIGYNIANTVAAFYRPPWVFDISLVAWLLAGVVALTVWTIRFADIDVRRGGVR